MFSCRKRANITININLFWIAYLIILKVSLITCLIRLISDAVFIQSHLLSLTPMERWVYGELSVYYMRKMKNDSRFRIDNVKPFLVFTTEAVINFLSVKENLTSLKYRHIMYGTVSSHQIAVNRQKYLKDCVLSCIHIFWWKIR